MLGFLTEHWPEKILSLLLAMLLWVYVTGQEKSEMGFAVPLELANIPPNMEIVNKIPHFITLRVRGSSGVLNNVKLGKIKVVLDLSHLKEGKNIFTITRDQIVLPKELVVTHISPLSLRIIAEEVAEKKVLVVLSARGIRPTWDVTLEPPEVLIRGVKSKVKRVKVVRTQPLRFLKGDIIPGKTLEKMVKLISPRQGLQLFPDRVKVIIKVREKGGKAP